MAKVEDYVILPRQKITDIADSIRTVLGTEDNFSIDEIPNLIGDLSSASAGMSADGIKQNIYFVEPVYLYPYAVK